MILLEGKTTCEDCNEPFDWYYYYFKEKISYQVYKIPIFKNKECATLVEENKDGTPKRLKAYCKRDECGYSNFFDIDYDKVKITKE